ncbi:MAG: toxin [bacterium]|nr:toxin [bacterium]
MKEIRFNKEKSTLLKRVRGVDFNEIKSAINQGLLIDTIDHYNKDAYRNQKIFLVRLKQYIFCVPFVEEDTYIFLKTLFPSRKYTKKYYHLISQYEKK